jgi:hypothetical protein
LHEFSRTFSSLDNIVCVTFHLFVPQIKPYSTWFEQCFLLWQIFIIFPGKKGKATSTKDFLGKRLLNSSDFIYLFIYLKNY